MKIKKITINLLHECYLQAPNFVAPPFESAETNCPIALEVPCLFSSNCNSATIILSSRTEPQFVHTASPLAGSTSMSEPPQFLHFRPDDIFHKIPSRCHRSRFEYDTKILSNEVFYYKIGIMS